MVHIKKFFKKIKIEYGGGISWEFGVSIYAMEDYSAIARMKFVLFVTTWMGPEDIMPSEIRERRIPQDLIYM